MYLSCFMGPLLHLAYDIYGGRRYLDDWPTYFGYMGYLNLAGIMLFKLGHNFIFRRARPAKSFWKMDPGRFIAVLIPAIVIALIATLVIRILFGGLVRHGRTMVFTGELGQQAAHISWILMLGDPAVLLVTIAIIYWISRRGPYKQRSLWVAGLVVIISFALQFLLVGQRGSRSAIVIAVVVITGIVHYRLRPFSPKLVLVGMYVAVTFVYLYGYYKFLGPKGWQAFYSAEARKGMAYELGRSGGSDLTGTVLHRGKADVQAFLLYRLMEFKGSYEPVYGLTYLETVFTLIPRGIWKTKPISIKADAGTALQGYSPITVSSAVYGLAGEAMLNFGYWGIVPAFFVYGTLLGWFRKKLATMEPSDSRFFLVPIVIITFGLALGADSRNLMMGLLKLGVLPLVVVFLGSLRSRFTPDNTAEIS
jgi:hypothetical protein